MPAAIGCVREESMWMTLKPVVLEATIHSPLGERLFKVPRSPFQMGVCISKTLWRWWCAGEQHALCACPLRDGGQRSLAQSQTRCRIAYLLEPIYYACARSVCPPAALQPPESRVAKTQAARQGSRQRP